MIGFRFGQLAFGVIWKLSAVGLDSIIEAISSLIGLIFDLLRLSLSYSDRFDSELWFSKAVFRKLNRLIFDSYQPLDRFAICEGCKLFVLLFDLLFHIAFDSQKLQLFVLLFDLLFRFAFDSRKLQLFVLMFDLRKLSAVRIDFRFCKGYQLFVSICISLILES